MTAKAMARGQRLREARLARGLDVHQVADRLGVRPQQVYRWEWGTCALHVDDVEAIAALYRESIGWIVAGKDKAAAKPAAKRRSA